MAVNNSWPLTILLLLLLIALRPSSSSSASAPPATELVRSVCNATSNYTFCVAALAADPRTPTADPYGLAFIAFGMAYLNASATQDLVSELLRKAARAGGRQAERLETCRRDYGKAAAALEMAYNDLNSETFFELAELAGDASRYARNCQAAFKDASERPLSERNRGLKGLCEICVAVSKLFTGGS